MTDPFILENQPKEYKLVPAGSHLARCYRIVDLGTQKSEYEGNVKFLRKVMINWELHSEDDEGQPLVTDKGEPLSISKDYTLSFAEKATLRKNIQGWFGTTFTDAEAQRYDVTQIVGQWCMLGVINKTNPKGKTYANVDTISAPARIYIKNGLPEPHNPEQIFRLNAPDLEMYEKFPNWLKTKILLSPEGQAMQKKYNLQEPSSFSDWQKGSQEKPKGKSSGFDDMEDDIPF